MTHEDVMQMLAETDIPFAYDHFAEGESPDPPFICFLFPSGLIPRSLLRNEGRSWG